MGNPTIHSVVVNYRTPEQISRFLRSYQDHPPERHGHALTVFQVAPTLEDLEAVKATAPADARLVMHTSNVGYNRAVNAAIATAAPADYYAIFNADVWLTVGALDELAEHLASDPLMAATGPRQIDEQGRVTAGGIFGTGASPRHRDWHRPVGGRTGDVRTDAVTIAGSAMMWRGSTWWQLTQCPRNWKPTSDTGADGAFAPCEHYFGETWACYHARAHGFRLGYLGTTMIGHSWHKASPVGGHGEQRLEADRALFRDLCDNHRPLIERD